MFLKIFFCKVFTPLQMLKDISDTEILVLGKKIKKILCGDFSFNKETIRLIRKKNKNF